MPSSTAEAVGRPSRAAGSAWKAAGQEVPLPASPREHTTTV
jgi:hypothetical protein